jgi:hypothetical protein
MDVNAISNIALLFVKTGLLKTVRPRDDLFRCWRVRPNGTATAKRIFERLRSAQDPDARHHAPCCPANRWSGVELVIQNCTCGAR